MIARIIPLLRLGRPCGFFDYAVPQTLQDSIRPGHLISIPFRKKKSQGIVWQLLENGNAAQELKSVDSIIQNNSYIVPRQMAFLEWFSERYAVSLAHAASIFIPMRPKRIVKKKHSEPVASPLFPFSNSIPFSPASENTAIAASDWNQYASYILSACAHHIDHQNQLLILTPSLHDAQLLYAFLNDAFPQRIVLVTGDSSASSIANAYALLAEHMCSIAISTRIALGWNIPKFASIIMLDAELRDYKQYDKNPRFDTRTVAEYISKEYGIPLVCLTMSPSCEMLARTDMSAIDDQLKSHASKAHPLVVDLVHSFRSGNRTFISNELQENVHVSLDSKKGVFLFLNRKGYGGLVRCSECQYTFSCDACKIAQRYSKRENSLRCTSCKATRALPDACPHCASHDFSFSGIGTEKIAQEASRHFPHARIIEANADEPLSVDALADLSATIVIGTSSFMQQHWEVFERIGCIGVIASDLLPSLSDFRSIEYQWHTLMRLAGIARTFSLPLILQAFDTESLPMQAIAVGDWERCITWQLEQRKRFGWPPYSRIIKIIARHHTALLPNAISELMKKLKQSFVRQKSSITLFRSSAMQFERRPYLLVRIAGLYRPVDPLPSYVREVISTILDDWLIDIDPVTF